MAVDASLLKEYRIAVEALLDAITVFEAKVQTYNGAEFVRLGQLVEKRHEELDEVRRQYERQEYERPDDLKQSG